MPKIDTTVTFIVPQSKSKDNPEGKKFVRGEADDTPLTLGYALASMLFNASMMDDKGATAGKKKFDRYKLAEKFSDADDAGDAGGGELAAVFLGQFGQIDWLLPEREIGRAHV